MTNTVKDRIRFAYGIVLSVSVFLAAVCLAASCFGIYRSGEFTRDIVAEAFSRIAVPVWLCLFLIAAGFILEWLLPRRAERLSGQMPYEDQLKRLHEKIDPDRCDAALWSQITAEQRRRRTRRSCAAGVIACCVFTFLPYVLNGDHFYEAESFNAAVISAMYALLPALAVAFGCALLTVFANRTSCEKEIALLKKAASSAKRPAPAKKPEPAPARPVQPWRLLALAAVVFLLVYGFVSGGALDVLTKAANICTECIGLG